MASMEAAQASAPVPLKRAQPERMGPAKPRGELDLTQLDFVGCEAVPMSPGRYRLISPASRAFPGWRAVDIHAALNEFGFSAHSLALVEGIGRLLGARDGTGPDDDPMLRSLRAESRAQGWAEVRAEARAKSIAKGQAEGGTESRARMVRGGCG